jgi:hypothetical protein
VQLSATSQSPAAARQIVVAEASTSAGQALLDPVQLSATSQPPSTASRHIVPAGLRLSAGQSAVTPSQVSATSHPPGTAARQTVTGLLQTKLHLNPLHVPVAQPRTQSPFPAQGTSCVMPQLAASVSLDTSAQAERRSAAMHRSVRLDVFNWASRQNRESLGLARLGGQSR